MPTSPARTERRRRSADSAVFEDYPTASIGDIALAPSNPDIAIQTVENLAVIATHGRGAWVIDLLPVRAAARK
jgi:hypothetical protein